MGLTLSREERERRRREKRISKAIESQNKADLNAERSFKKFLLLGAGESGKSTLFKQMVQLYGKGYSENDRKLVKKTVYANVIAAMTTLIEQCALRESEDEKYKITSDALEYFKENVQQDTVIDDEVAGKIRDLWSDPAIKAIWEERSKIQVIDSAAYLFDRIEQIGSEDYVPDYQDMLRIRVRTTGIMETEFDVDGRKFRIFDVGGQRNERKKWIHCFENVTAVIFVAALSEYDQVLFEDDTTNRMKEALQLFDDICNSHWFLKTSIILFLNKNDLFVDKIQKVPITVCPVLKDFPGDDPNDYDQAVNHIRSAFEAKNQSETKKVYAHITTATDESNIDHVFRSVRDIVITQSLVAGGLY
ncbi:MAG: hypothetical protein MHM6MM_001737 [Cercozoa sp. M6MM]